MKKLALPDVTLVLADTVCHELSRRAIQDCLDVVDFGDVLVFSDQPIVSRFHRCSFRNLEDHDQFRWYGIPQHVKTSHMLIIEWDSWVLNPGTWDNHWLDFDYNGAPWPWHQDRKIGNGGFSLRSADMMRWVATNSHLFNNRVHEDDVLCREHRPTLEQHGFLWTPDNLAERFSFERGKPSVKTFGFHGIFNWPQVLDSDALRERLSLVTPYVRTKSEWSEVAQFA